MNLDEIKEQITRVINGESGAVEGMAELVRAGDEETLWQMMSLAGESMIMAWTAQGKEEEDLRPIWDAIEQRANELGMEL